MKMIEIARTLNEEDSFIAELANFIADYTDLPANIVPWTKTQPSELPHTKYRMKIFKDRIHCATYTISKAPELKWQLADRALQLDASEAAEVKQFIGETAGLFIQYVDGRLSAADVKIELKKMKGAK